MGREGRREGKREGKKERNKLKVKFSALRVWPSHLFPSWPGGSPIRLREVGINEK